MTSTSTRVGAYRVLDEIGRGGMGVVYRAEREDGALVALKVMAPELAVDEAFRERFTRESQLVIDHPHIVPIYDAGVADARLYMAMYLVNGSDLKALIRAEGRLLPARILSFFKQAADALDAAHGHGLVHRDVKPQNFLIEAREDGSVGGSEHVYLSDFGLVKRVAGQTSLTGSAHLVGTAQYMSPEQIRGRQVDGRTDVYALGCVLYEALTGSPPFAAEEEVAVLWGHVNEEAARVSQRVPVLPEALDDVLAKAMAKDPNDRYLTAGDFADDLQAVLDPGSASRRSGLWTSLDASGPRSAPTRHSTTGSPALTTERRGVAGWVAAVVVAIVAAALLVTRGGDIPVLDTLAQLPEGEGQEARPAGNKNDLRRPDGERVAGNADDPETAVVQRLRAGLPDTIAPAQERPATFRAPAGSSGAGSSTGSPDIASHPASGTYVYSQSGHDRICPEGRACLSGSDLPDTQEVTIGQTGPWRTPVLIAVAEVSRRFAFASTIRYGFERALLSDMQMSFETEFGDFRVRLDPDPPPTWLVFPFSPRTHLNGTWSSGAPGHYTVDVVDTRRISIAGRKVDAVQVRTSLEWEGSHPGVMESVLWIARDTRVVLESATHLRVATNVQSHEYDVSFSTRLQRGPAYGG